MANSKLRDFRKQEEKDIVLDMSPMIDMVFLLLIFFIVVSTPMIVKVDPDVKPAVAYNSIKPEDTNGRIVINVRGENDYRKSDYKDKDNGKMETQDQITEHIKKEVERINRMNPEYKPRIHLRGHKEALFECSQLAIAGAAAAGVNDIIFSVFPFASN